MKHVGNVDRPVKFDLQGRSVDIVPSSLAFGEGEKHKLWEHCFQVAAIGNVTSKLVKVPLVKSEHGERRLGQEQIPGRGRQQRI